MMAWMSLATAVASVTASILLMADSVSQALIAIPAGTAFGYAALWAMTVPSYDEEASDRLRTERRQLVAVAQVGAVGMLAWALLDLRRCTVSTAGIMALSLTTGTMAFWLALHAFPKAYPSCRPILEEPFIESEPAPDTPPVPANPDLHRYSHVLQKLRSRGYR